jgi:SAM-dependent methyltransferase
LQKFNLLGHPEKLTRDIQLRIKTTEKDKLLANEFGLEYFDGTRSQGYGGYHYDGRWVPVAKRVIERYGIHEGASLLDVGCAKGFLIQDLSDLDPSIVVRGIDVSDYARNCARPDIRQIIDLGSCDKLPYEDNSFDCCLAINVIHNLDFAGCKKSIEEMQRVVRDPRKIFIQVDAYTSANELKMFEQWLLTAKTYLNCNDWLRLFEEVGYSGDYFWTIIGFDKQLNL